MGKTIDGILKNFYVKLPTGSKRTVTIGAEVPVEYHRWLEELAASKDYPEYKTRSDIIRDCLHIGLLLRTHPEYRQSQELEGLRAGIEALLIHQRVEDTRRMTDELAHNLRSIDPKSKAGIELLARSETFHSTLDSAWDKQRLGNEIANFKTK